MSLTGSRGSRPFQLTGPINKAESEWFRGRLGEIRAAGKLNPAEVRARNLILGIWDGVTRVNNRGRRILSRVRWNVRHRGRVFDFYFPGIKCAIEVDGVTYHDRERDERRDKLISAETGCRIYRCWAFNDSELLRALSNVIFRAKESGYDTRRAELKISAARSGLK